MVNKKAIRIALSATAIAALLAGCGSSEAPSGNHPAGGNASAGAGRQDQRHNQADIAFAQEMIPHHEQAIEMAAMVPDRSTNPDVIALAKQIDRAQGPEITTMRQWLRAWGADEPKAMNGGGMGSMDPGGRDHGGHGMTGMPGMMSGQQMTRLRNTKGAAFDRMWLQMMISHHEGAVTMSKKEQNAGVHPAPRNSPVRSSRRSSARSPRCTGCSNDPDPAGVGAASAVPTPARQYLPVVPPRLPHWHRVPCVLLSMFLLLLAPL